jgi:hypothetical protein
MLTPQNRPDITIEGELLPALASTETKTLPDDVFMLISPPFRRSESRIVRQCTQDRNARSFLHPLVR